MLEKLYWIKNHITKNKKKTDRLKIWNRRSKARLQREQHQKKNHLWDKTVLKKRLYCKENYIVRDKIEGIENIEHIVYEKNLGYDWL